MTDLITRLRAMHKPRTTRYGSGCIQCGILWPCPTLQAVNDASADAPPADQTERRERYASAIRDTSGWVLDDGQHMIDAVLAVADAEQVELRRERDLAIAHDRQPYPTAWAYEQACTALRRKSEAIERIRTGLDALKSKGATGQAYHSAISKALDGLPEKAQQAEPIVTVHAAPDLSPAAEEALGALVDVAKTQMTDETQQTGGQP